MHLIAKTQKLRETLKNLPHPHVLVPTMGALHDGHLALIKRARKLAGDTGTVILTLFLNPTQFNNPDDLKNYPQTLDEDIELCKANGVDVLFTPSTKSMYLPDNSVSVTESSLSKQLCGASRPGHFNGVCTVVLKLFNLTQPDIAVFGKKDYQQLAIIKRMVRDLDIPIDIEGVETIREASGLALSSRNTRLTQNQRLDAARIRRALLATQKAFQSGETKVDKLLATARPLIENPDTEAVIDYLEILDANSLTSIKTIDHPAILATAVFYGDVRLIDNIELFPSE